MYRTCDKFKNHVWMWNTWEKQVSCSKHWQKVIKLSACIEINIQGFLSSVKLTKTLLIQARSYNFDIFYILLIELSWQNIHLQGLYKYMYWYNHH